MKTFTIIHAVMILAAMYVLVEILLLCHYRAIRDREAKKAFFDCYIKWAFFTTVVLLAGQGLCYYGTRLLTAQVPHHIFGSSLDEKIPLLSFFIVIYFLTFPVIVFAPFYLAAAGGKKLLQRYIPALLILFALTGAVYLIAPNDVPRGWQPERYYQHTGVFDRMLQFMYDADDISNGLPSLHNAHIWLVFFVIVFNAPAKKALAYGLPAGVLGALISLSTLFCKEHYLIDVAVSVPLAAVIAWFTRRRRRRA